MFVSGRRNFISNFSRRMFEQAFQLQTVGELGLKSKYLSSEYKKPLCIELEDVKLIQTTESDLEVETHKRLVDARCETTKKMKDGDVSSQARWMKQSFDKLLNYVLQFLPPTTMIVLQVITDLFREEFRA